MFELRDVRADVVISFYPCVSPLCVSRTCVVIGLGRYAAFQLVPSDGWDDIGCDASSLSNVHARDGEQRSYHPDHQACGRITLDAAFFQGNKYMYKHNALPTHAHNTKDMRCTQLSPPHLHTPRLLPRTVSSPTPPPHVPQRLHSIRPPRILLLEPMGTIPRVSIRRSCNAGRARLAPLPPASMLPITRSHAVAQSKLATYLLHASQVPSVAWVDEFLRFIGTRTQQTAADDFAEGFQFYN